MSRSERLLDLIQLLRRHRRPVSGAAIAAELAVSLRTLYRDIATLQSQGAPIDGAPGLGYVLRDGFVLPPLMFPADELEALALGTRWVAERGDPRLAVAARDAMARIAAVLPAALRCQLDEATLLVGPARPAPASSSDTGSHGAAMRLAIRQQCKLELRYRDAAGHDSARTVWPFALGYFDQVQVLVAWCELRGAVRHFRCDRVTALVAGSERYPQPRQALLKAWRLQQGMADDR